MPTFTDHVTYIKTQDRQVSYTGYQLNLGLISSSYGGITTSSTVPTYTVRQARWPVLAFANSYNQALYVITKLPSVYVPGNVTVTVYWTANTTTGNAYFNAGLGAATGTLWPLEANMTYKGLATVATSAIAYTRNVTSYVFDGTAFLGLDDLVFVLLRNAVSATDTVEAIIDVDSVAFKYSINAMGAII